MAELGHRANVMGPQPIGEPAAIPAAVTHNAHHILDLLAQHKPELAALGTPDAARELGELAGAAGREAIGAHEIIAIARVNRHYYIKARLNRANSEPMLVQLRIGQQGGRWMIWEAMNLTGRTAWTSNR